jgi:hypothetical protein
MDLFYGKAGALFGMLNTLLHNRSEFRRIIQNYDADEFCPLHISVPKKNVALFRGLRKRNGKALLEFLTDEGMMQKEYNPEGLRFGDLDSLLSLGEPLAERYVNENALKRRIRNWIIEDEYLLYGNGKIYDLVSSDDIEKERNIKRKRFLMKIKGMGKRHNEHDEYG